MRERERLWETPSVLRDPSRNLQILRRTRSASLYLIRRDSDLFRYLRRLNRLFRFLMDLKFMGREFEI